MRNRFGRALTTKVDTTNLVDSLVQVRLEALSELLKASSHVEGGQVAVLGLPGLSDAGEEEGGNHRKLHLELREGD